MVTVLCYEDFRATPLIVQVFAIDCMISGLRPLLSVTVLCYEDFRATPLIL
ncbi:MAG: hypothetical protein K1X92_12505 [Bacteroidia bacterium]|nr:hypothetical protein [Bacteroidia bacterium]